MTSSPRASCACSRSPRIAYGSYAFAWLIIGELSTPFLNVNFFVKQCGAGDLPLCKLNNGAFGFFFFLTRVVAYGAGVAQLLQAPYKPDAPDTFQMLVRSVIALGLALNLYWFVLIVRKFCCAGVRQAKD